MELKEALNNLHSHKTFKEWKDAHKNSYFSHAFCMLKDKDSSWQLGYYEKDDDSITSFVVKEDEVEVREDEEVFKKKEMTIKEVDMGKVKLSLAKVLEKANTFQEKNYPKDTSLKIIAILQHVDSFGSVWNITYVTQAFNTLNMKIDPKTGSILDHHLSSIMSFKQN